MLNLKKTIATALTVATIISGYSGLVNAASSPRPSGTENVGENLGDLHNSEGATLHRRRGDANLDGVINGTDATHILRYINERDSHKVKIPLVTRYRIIYGNDPSDPNYEEFEYLCGIYYEEMDVDGKNGVTQVDATLLLRYLLWRDV